MSVLELTWVVWALIGAGVTAVVVISVIPGSGVPTLGSVISRWKVHRIGRFALIVAWMWLGWHLFAR
ncbi:MAG: DUF6186 family protein [Acidimicrobiales bacterium]